MRPSIGLVPLYDEKKDSYWMLPGYMIGLEKSGATPLMLPLTDNPEELEYFAKTCDGILLTGGNDVAPAMYGEADSGKCGYICELRDKMEARLFRLALKYDKPMLGICRGHQIMNVCLGGTMWQDLPSERPSDVIHHMDYPYDRSSHEINIVKSTILHDIVGKDRIGVNSCHHQAIKELSPKLRVMAAADDGIIESVCMPDRNFVVGVQWHPEFSYLKDPISMKIFAAFVKACGK